MVLSGLVGLDQNRSVGRDREFVNVQCCADVRSQLSASAECLGVGRFILVACESWALPSQDDASVTSPITANRENILRANFTGTDYCSTGFHVLSGLNSVIAEATSSVVFPTSFWSKTPFWLIMKVMMPESRYCAG